MLVVARLGCQGLLRPAVSGGYVDPGISLSIREGAELASKSALCAAAGAEMYECIVLIAPMSRLPALSTTMTAHLLRMVELERKLE